MTAVRPRRVALDLGLAAFSPCTCGGRYSLSYVGGEPLVFHTEPPCDRFRAVVTADDAVRFSEENRAAVRT